MKQKLASGQKIICLNRKASFNYFFLELIEAGISLKGSEVKSLRDGKGNIADSYAADINGELFLFNPSSTTFVKHFLATTNRNNDADGTGSQFARAGYNAGYFNTTSAVDAMQFKMSSGNIDAGTIKLYGLKDS